jgi:hypothetical protein
MYERRPAKSLPMQAIMLYFSGSGVQIFSLGMIFMLLTSPIGAVLNLFSGKCRNTYHEHLEIPY